MFPVHAPPCGKSSSTTEVLEFCRALALPADLVGRWVWIRFDAKPSQEIRDTLKAAGFRWVKRRGQWAHNCGYWSKFNPRVNDPREIYGSVPVASLRDESVGAA